MMGEELFKICSLYENYKFRTPRRLQHASPTKPQDETTGQAARCTVRRKEQGCSIIDGNGPVYKEPSYRRHPAGKLHIKCSEEVDVASISYPRCRIGEERVYKHCEPPLMVTANKLPPIPKHIQGTSAKIKSKEPQGEVQDTKETGTKYRREDDDVVTGSEKNNYGKKVVSFGRAKIMDDRRLTNNWTARRPNHALLLKPPSPRYKAPGDDFNQDSKALLPRRGRLHVRFPGKRGQPVHPTMARLKAEDSRGIQPTLPLTGVSILKPAKPLMVIPTPCFPCSPEFERTFKSLRDQKKNVATMNSRPIND